VADRHQPRLWYLREVAGQIRPPVPEPDDPDADHRAPRWSGSIALRRAGTPTTVASAATSRVTTAPAPITARSPMVTPHRITAPEPIDALRLTSVRSRLQSPSPCSRPATVARGWRSLMNITPWPTNTSSSIVTPSQTNVCDEILQRAPISA